MAIIKIQTGEPFSIKEKIAFLLAGITVALLFIWLAIILLIVQPQEDVKCKIICTKENLTFRDAKDDSCSCAPDKPYYEEGEIRIFYKN